MTLHDHQHDMSNMCSMLRYCVSVNDTAVLMLTQRKCSRVTYCLRLFSNQNVLHKQAVRRRHISWGFAWSSKPWSRSSQ